MRGNFQDSKYINSYENFVNAINSSYTERSYKNGLKMYLKFHNIKDYDSLLQIDKDMTFEMLRNSIIFQRKQRKLSLSRINVCFSALKLFYSMNRYDEINWYTLARYKGKERKKMVNDRAYTREEIQKLLQFADLRMKVIILILLSTGVRTGGLASIHLKDIEYIEQYKLYRMFVYSEDIDGKYYTFCTPECATFIQLYLDYRKNQGEELGPESPLIRQVFDSTKEIEVTSEDIQERMRYLLIKAGFKPKRNRDPNRKKLTDQELIELRRTRSEVMRCHGLRKFFDTICIDSDMKNIPKELIMGHKKEQGLDRHYYRPTSNTLLNEYLKVVDALTINEENRLSKQVQELLTKNQDKDYVIKGKLQEKDEEIKGMREQINEMNKKFEQVFSLIQQNPKLAKIKPEALQRKIKL